MASERTSKKMTTEEIIRDIIACSLSEWLKDETNSGPLEPTNTAMDHKLSYRIHDCIRDILKKRFSDKGSFFKFRKRFTDYQFVIDKDHHGWYRTKEDANNVVSEILADNVMTALNLDNSSMEDDKPRMEPIKICLWVSGAFAESNVRSGLRSWIRLGNKCPKLEFWFQDWSSGFNSTMTEDVAAETLAATIPSKESVLKSVDHELHARSLVYGRRISREEAIDNIIDELMPKIRESFNMVQGSVVKHKDLTQCDDRNTMVDKQPLTVNMDKLRKTLENIVKGTEKEVMFAFNGWNDNANEIMTKDYVLDILNLSIPDKNTILREINLTLHKKNPYNGFMTEREATEIVLDKIIEKVKLSVKILNNEFKENMIFCIKETYSKSDVDPHVLALGGKTPGKNDLDTKLTTRVYGKTKIECIHKFLSKTTIKDEDGLHDRIAKDLMTNGRATIFCNVGKRIVNLIEM